jgi:hypothetical protein
MPANSQVRYFNDVDKQTAEQVRDIVNKIRPDVEVVRLGLPVSAGRLEVWITKI